MSELLLSAITPAARRESGETAIDVSRPMGPASASPRSVHAARPGGAVRLAVNGPPALTANWVMPPPSRLVTGLSTGAPPPVRGRGRSANEAASGHLPRGLRTW